MACISDKSPFIVSTSTCITITSISEILELFKLNLHDFENKLPSVIEIFSTIRRALTIPSTNMPFLVRQLLNR
jgi:hypothetical protein